MKKLLIILIVLATIIIMVPFLGNTIVESSIQNRLEVLTSYGLKIKKSTTDVGYLRTKKHFVFLVEDSKSFLSYLNQFSDAQLPPYIGALIDGAELGLDIAYSNIPISDAVSVDIYPNSLSSKMLGDINALFKEKAILYHLDYDVLHKDFDGYIKDLNASYTTKQGVKVSMLINNAKFSGKGLLIAPDTLLTSIAKLNLSMEGLRENMQIKLSDLSSTTAFESKTTYTTTLKLKNISWSAKSPDVPQISLEMKNLLFDFSSNTQSAKADFYTKTSFDNMRVQTRDVSIDADLFNYDLALRGLDTAVYGDLVSLISKSKVALSPELEKEMEKKMLELVSQGMVLDIADISIKKLATRKTKELGGLKIKAKVTFKKEKSLSKKLATNPLALMQNMDLSLLFKISQVMYAKLSLISPVLNMAQNFAKIEKENLIFDIKLKDAKLSVNGQEIH